MRYRELQKIDKLYFGYEEMAKALRITKDSARVYANRYVKQKLLLRVKRNIYVPYEKWRGLETEELFILANIALVPSYISLMTAMDYYEITSQVQRGYIESIAIKRTKEINVAETVFSYTKVDKKLYFGFSKNRNFFIASPEKAFLDALYLTSLKRYSFDLSSIDKKKLNWKALKKLACKFPKNTERMLKGI